MSYEDLPPGPDIDNLDLTNMDRGNELPSADPEPEDQPAEEPKATPKAEEPKAEEPAEEPEAEDPPAEDPEEEQPRDKDGKFASKEARIPKSRFDEAVNKEREAREAAEARALALERQIASMNTAKADTAKIEEMEGTISDLEKRHAQLLVDGDVEEASKVMREIRHTERQIAKMEAVGESTQLTAQAFEAQRLDALIDVIESSHPQLNPAHESYDQDMSDLVLAKQGNYMRNGLSRYDALKKATEDVASKYFKAADPEPKAEPKVDKAAERKQEAVKKNLAASKAQPASMKDVGMDSDKFGQTGVLPDPNKMSVEDLAALPEATLRRMRGDSL